MRMYLVAAVLAATIVGSASASPGLRVAFVVDVSFTGTESTVTSSIPGCPSATVTTSGGAGFGGPIGRFFGTKTFDCGASGTFTLSFRAHAFGCNPTDSGTWMMVRAPACTRASAARASWPERTTAPRHASSRVCSTHIRARSARRELGRPSGIGEAAEGPLTDGRPGSSNSRGWTRTNNPPVNSRMLCQLSYAGSQRR